MMLWIGLCSQARAETVRVGGYVFPPYVETENQTVRGMTLDLIEAMNAFQPDIRFEFVFTSSQRRYRDFENGKFDALFFEDILWGWQDKGVATSNVFLKDGEVFIAKASPEKNQAYFEQLEGKSIAGYLGYHYAFAGFNADKDFLLARFNMQLNTNHQGNIEKVLTGRVDLAIVTKSYLQRYLKEHADAKDHLLISSTLDQEYHHTILLKTQSRVSIEKINALLADMEKAGMLSRLWKRYGLE